MVIRPSMVKRIVHYSGSLDRDLSVSVRLFMTFYSKYEIAAEKRVIPTGIELEKDVQVHPKKMADLRQAWYFFETMLLSRVSCNVQAVLYLRFLEETIRFS